MALLQTVVGLVALIVLGNILSHFIPRVPVSLIQIALGLIAALIFNIKIELETEWFLLLFIAPLLYSDAWRFPKKELWELRGPIFGNAILLVFLTTLVGGALIYWFVPELPMPVAIAIAAIISPTDPVAVQAIAKEAKLPKNVMHLVAGESLINDASGLVGFKFAVAAASVGTFSILEATGEFLYISLMGAVAGLVIGFVLNWLSDFLVDHGSNDVIFRVVMQLFSPFLIYFLAEEIHASGVIAVVTGAIVSNLHMKADVDYSGELAVVGFNTWNVFGYLLNGFLFVILGIELPVATEFHNAAGQTVSVGTMLYYAFGTWVIVFGIRVLWTYATQFTRHLSHKDENPSWRVAFLSGLSGVRGAITMAGVMTVPLFTETGMAFPQRQMMLFIAAVVIIISLLAAVIFIPIVLAGENEKGQVAPGEDHEHAPVARHMTEPRARIYALQSAVREIESHRRESNQATAYEIILRYQVQIRQLQMRYMNLDRLNPLLDAEMKLRTVALEAERSAMRSLLVDEEISPLVFASESRRIDRAEADLVDAISKRRNRTLRNLRLWFVQAVRGIRVWFSDESSDKLIAEYKLAQHEAAKAAISAISDYLAVEDTKQAKSDQAAAYNLIIAYRSRLEREKWADEGVAPSDEITTAMELEVMGLNAQREAVQQLYDAHFISYETGLNIRQSINFAEAGLLTLESEEE
jgi:CPA1 family monovalent cation:H+ antiporter